jgi:methionine-S-sulfoxide reductase
MMERQVELGNNQELATMAGGCFWGVEELARALNGVVDTEVGYTGGITKNPVYETVKEGNTSHTEAIQITFEPRTLAYADLLRWFFTMHDPTTLNRQGNDRGTQYRSVIFYHSEEQKATALKIKAEATEKWKKPLVTEIIPAVTFYSAEKYHQDYLQKNPGGYTCHWIRDL